MSKTSSLPDVHSCSRFSSLSTTNIDEHRPLTIITWQQLRRKSLNNNGPSSPSINDLNNSYGKSANLSHSSSQSSGEMRHTSELEIEVKQKQQQKLKIKESPSSISSSSPIVRSREFIHSRTPSLTLDETCSSQIHQTPKRRIFSNSIPTQTPSLLIQTNGRHDEKHWHLEKIRSLLQELSHCQTIIQQQEQQVINIKKERDHLSLMVDERTNDLCNLKQKNEQLEQMIRDGNEHRHEQEQLQRIDQQIQSYKSDALQMHEQILSLTQKLEQITEENQRLQEENHNYQVQIEHERNQIDESIKSRSYIDIELEQTRQMLRSQQYQHENQCRIIEEKHQKDLAQVIEEKKFLSKRCEDLLRENYRLQKTLTENENDRQQKIRNYQDKNSILMNQVEELEKTLMETKKQLETVTREKDETLADMLVAVRVASELRHDAEDRLNKANDDLKRVTEHIEHERVSSRRKIAAPIFNASHPQDVGHVKIKEMIRTLEANAQNSAIRSDSNNRQRPLSQPCTRAETQAMQNDHSKKSNETTNYGQKLTRKSSTSLNNSSRSITSEQYDEMKSIIETVLTRIPGSVCKREALMKWCVERLERYCINITNFSNCWTDGMAFCALLHSYLPDRIDLDMMRNESKKKRFEVAFDVATSVGIVPILDIEEMCSSEWPDWERVMYYVALIFRHFEGSPRKATPPSTLFNSLVRPTMFCSSLQTV